MSIRAIATFILSTSALFSAVKAQEWNIKNYSLGYKVFEVHSIGNSPLTIAPLLKEPSAYEKHLGTITSNSLYGNPGVLNLKTMYINAEWQRINPSFRFWRKYTLQAGLLFTGRIRQEAGAIGEESFFSSTDTAIHINMYSLTKVQQFFGGNAGVNRRFTISKRLKFLTGLHGQGSVALVHKYQQRWDSSRYTPSGGWIKRTLPMPKLKGKNFFEWQVRIPLGLEYAFYKDKACIRLEADVGLIGSRYRAKNFLEREALGAGLWLLYRPYANR